MRRRKVLWAAGIAFAIMIVVEALIVIGGAKLLVQERLVRPGTDLVIPEYGNLKSNQQASLVCRYITGRGVMTDVLWYSPNNIMGRNECPFFKTDALARADKMETGSLADWVSGLATVLATIVALGSYFWADNHRKREERQRRQDSAYQIGFKLATLISEAVSTHKALFPQETTADDWREIADPFQIVGRQQPTIGFDATMVRDLTDAEQNLLMSLREEDFLMNMSETIARNETIRLGLSEYKAQHQALTMRLPPPNMVEGQVASLMLDDQQRLALWPYVTAAATLITAIRKLSEENVAMFRKMGSGFHAMMQKHYPDLHIHKIEDVTQQAADAQTGGS